MHIKFSIIIPVYKTEEFLHRSLYSAINQTYNNIEVIVVNDGSPGDKCDSILKRVNDKRIKYIKKDKNEGLYLARKSGIMEAESDFIIHLDADDELKLDACQTLSDKIRSQPMMLDADYITYRYEVYNVSISSLDDIADNLDDLLTFKKYHMVWAKTYSTNFLKKIFKDTPNFYLVHFEDYYQEAIIEYWAKNRNKIDSVLYIHYPDIGVSKKSNYNNLELFEKIDNAAQNILLYLSDFFSDKDSSSYIKINSFIESFYIQMLQYINSTDILTRIVKRIGVEKFIIHYSSFAKNKFDYIDEKITLLNYLRPFAKISKPFVTILRKIKNWIIKKK